jgi:hypothetical protein
MRYQLSVFDSGVVIVINIDFCIRISVIKRVIFIREFRFQKRAENSIFKSYIISGAGI